MDNKNKGLDANASNTFFPQMEGSEYFNVLYDQYISKFDTEELIKNFNTETLEAFLYETAKYFFGIKRLTMGNAEMQSVGSYNTIRPVDSLGRVLVPMEMRNVLGWQEADKVFVGFKGDTVYMRKFTDTCTVCRNLYDAKPGENICQDCIDKLSD